MREKEQRMFLTISRSRTLCPSPPSIYLHHKSRSWSGFGKNLFFCLSIIVAGCKESALVNSPHFNFHPFIRILLPLHPLGSLNRQECGCDFHAHHTTVLLTTTYYIRFLSFSLSTSYLTAAAAALSLIHAADVVCVSRSKCLQRGWVLLMLVSLSLSLSHHKSEMINPTSTNPPLHIKESL